LQAMNRSLFHVISGGYGIVKPTTKQLQRDSKKTIIEWKVDDTVQVN
jgi:NAD/NADP transhydrogenase beta subunit